MARTPASGAVGVADALLNVAAAQAGMQLSPDPLTVCPGSTSAFALTVTNRGDNIETFDIAVGLPAGWEHQLQLNGRDVVSVTLPPSVLNSVDLTLLVTPNPGATAGDYPVSVRAVEHQSGIVAASTMASASLINRGVAVQILGGPGSVDPHQGGIWEVRVTNSGQVADSFRLGVAGPVAGAAGLSAGNVSLDPGASQTVQLNVGNMFTIAPGGYPLQVTAVSEGNNDVADSDRTTVNVGSFEAIEVSWRCRTPPTRRPPHPTHTSPRSAQ